jgi:dolichyl-phosphate beta-glucosyltransferase
MVKDPKNLSVVIPAYNEASRLPGTLCKVLAYCTANFKQFEVLICDDGSTDGTQAAVHDIIENPHFVFLREGVNQGKGAAVRRGVLAASHDFILVCDADLSTPIKEVEKLFPVAIEGKVAIGSRGIAGSQLVYRQHALRERMGKIFNLIIRLALGFSVRDSQCGFKLFPAAVARQVFETLVVKRFAFDVEVLLKAMKMGTACVEVPVIWRDSIPSRVHVIHDSLRMLFDVVRIGYKYGKLR